MVDCFSPPHPTTTPTHPSPTTGLQYLLAGSRAHRRQETLPLISVSQSPHLCSALPLQGHVTPCLYPTTPFRGSPLYGGLQKQCYSQDGEEKPLSLMAYFPKRHFCMAQWPFLLFFSQPLGTLCQWLCERREGGEKLTFPCHPNPSPKNFKQGHAHQWHGGGGFTNSSFCM